MDLSTADLSRLQQHLLDMEETAHRERMTLAEQCGWTFKRAGDLRYGDYVLLPDVEGCVWRVPTNGPEGIAIQVGPDEASPPPVKHFAVDELVPVRVLPSPEPF